jgi:diadenosine tetraphosphatase ApaH/serine/threonine PP2A family protein phosphatase
MPLGITLPDEEELISLLREAQRILSKEPQLLRVEAASVLVVGDTHGDVETSLKALEHEAEVKVFLGDYVDRGEYQLENIVTLLRRKLEEPERLILLRGNHETPEMNRYYGFLDEVLSRYSMEVYEEFVRVFSSMSYAVLINGAVLGVHGGVARGLVTLEQIRSLPKGDVHLKDPIAFQLLWNDPDERVAEFSPSPRGPGAYLFGAKPLEEFLSRNNLRALVRAHQPFPEGYRVFFEGKLVSVFSCSFYPISSPKGLLLENGKIKIVELV